MTVGSTSRSVSYTTTGLTLGPFAVPFQFFEIEVLVDDILVSDSLYTVTGGRGLTGSVTFVLGNEPDGALVIRGATAIVQQTDYEDNSAFSAETHEKALDRLTMIAQEMVEFVDTSYTFSPDAVGLYSGRSTYNSEVKNFAYLATDGDGDAITDPVFFFKLSAASGDWSAAVLARGEQGLQGETGAAGTNGATGATGATGAAGATATAAAQSDMEAATSTTTFVPPGRQHMHPGHLKAKYIGTLTFAALPGALSSTDTGNQFLWSTAHGLVNGDVMATLVDAPAGIAVNNCYYTHVISTTRFTLHTNRADAITGANTVTVSSPISASMSAYKVTRSDVLRYGIQDVGGIAIVPARTDMGIQVTLTTALSSAAAGGKCSWSGVKNVSGHATTGHCPIPTTVTTTVVSWTAPNFFCLDQADGSMSKGDGTPSGQATTAFRLEIEVYGDQ